jgi:acetyl esterase/lipase
VEHGKPVPLWPDAAPGALGIRSEDIPTLTLFHPADPCGTSLVILPGGGYRRLAEHERSNYAAFFNEHGITCFLLRYRLGSSGYRHPAMLQDAARAIRLILANAGQWNINPEAIGIIGSSAGGHLAATLLTKFDQGDPHAPDIVERQSCRPDFGILCYPVITMGEGTHPGTRDQLLGENASAEWLFKLSAENHVTSATPPCFLWHTLEDASVPVENSLHFARALRKASVPFELHLYEKGAHGMGLGENHPWSAACIHWMRQRKLLPAL